jgi:ABC-2 type transport system ATP-binding protein
VILTTHDLADVERLCRRIILIDRGRVLFDGTVERLKAEHAPYRELVVRVASGATEAGAPLALAGVEVVATEPGLVRLRFDPALAPVHVLVAEVAARYTVSDLSLVEPELESIVRELYERRPGSAAGRA